MKKAGIIFDFDDTLVYSHELFLAAQAQFCRRMKELGLYDEELVATIEARDIANVRAAGYMAVECFPLALGQTYESYCAKYGSAVEAAEMERLLSLGREAFSTPPREMEGARELLGELRQNYREYRLLLFTQGEQAVQQKRVEQSGFKQYFDSLHIVQIKDINSLSALLEQEQIDSARSWYVGNSLRADINPALAAGLSAVHFNIKGWSYEQEPPSGEYHLISSLTQFTELLRKQGELRR